MLKKQKKQAIPFITINTQTKNNKQKSSFILNPKALQLFTSPQLKSKKLAIVAIAGPQRSGKSFLANRLLKQMDGFAVGPSTNPCTKGIWIWSEPVKISEDTSMIIIDTEGLNSVQRDINVDVKIFALSVLLSSVFIYNSLGHIDEKALQNMSLVLNITNNICLRKDSKTQDQDIAEFFPHFYWVLRDFSLDLNGKTQKQYLENELAFVNNDQKDPKNMIRSKIKKFFTFRRCQCFVRPVVDEKKLAHIEQMKYQDLRVQFRQKLDSFLSTFFNNLPVKTIAGKPITGQMFVGLTMEYLNAINEGGVPEILTSLERVISSQSRKVMEELQSKYQLTMADFMKEGKIPMDESELQEHHKYCVGILVGKFDERLKLLLNQTQYKQLRKDLDKIIEKQFTAKLRTNQQKSELKCKQLWEKFIKSFKMVEIEKADEIPASLVIQKGKEFQKAMRKFLEETKAPRKYTFFIDKVPSFLFDYFDTVVQKIKKVYGEEMTKAKVATKQAQQQQDKVKKTMLEQDKLLLDRQRQIQQVIREKDMYKQKYESIEVEHGNYEYSSNMATADLERNLETRKQKNVELKAENSQLNQSLTKHKAELAQKKIEIISLQRRIRELERDGQPLETEEMAGEIITTLSDVRQKLSEMDDYYKKRLDETNPQQKRIRQMEELRTEKLQAIQRADENYKQKKEELIRNKEQMKKQYEKTIQILNKRAQNIQLENIQLKKHSVEFPGNEQKVKAFMNEKRKLEDALDLKQNNLTIQTNLNHEKDRKIMELENVLNDLKDKFAVKTADNARLKSFKESMGFILKESLCYVQGKANKLKHSVQPLDAEDFEIVRDVFAELGFKPF